MDDDNLITAVRESFTGVRSATTVEQIVSRSRSVRARRVSGVAVALGATGAAGLAVGIALPASHPAAGTSASHPVVGNRTTGPEVQLAAWTITRETDGNIQITFREATDAARLQRTLRADGVPASITFTGRQNPACQPYSSPASQAYWPFGQKTGPLVGAWFIHHPKDAYTTPYALVIDPAALPSGAGLQISTSGTPGPADNFQLNVSLVKTSPQCTGS
jgi:hypothetical protein